MQIPLVASDRHLDYLLADMISISSRSNLCTYESVDDHPAEILSPTNVYVLHLQSGRRKYHDRLSLMFKVLWLSFLLSFQLFFCAPNYPMTKSRHELEDEGNDAVSRKATRKHEIYPTLSTLSNHCRPNRVHSNCKSTTTSFLQKQ